VIGLLALGAWAQGDAYRRDRGRPRRRVQPGWPHPGSAVQRCDRGPREGVHL